MFREIREIKREEDERNRHYGYMDIKPETDITVEEAKNYIMMIFEQQAQMAQNS